MISEEKHLIGRSEWVTFPELRLPPVLARIDTGATTSSLHAYEMETFTRDDTLWLRFKTHPKHLETSLVITCEAKVIAQKAVRSSNGHETKRFVIETLAIIGNQKKRINLTLTNRDNMRFRMLLGRQAMQKFNFIVDVSHKAVLPKPDFSKQL